MALGRPGYQVSAAKTKPTIRMWILIILLALVLLLIVKQTRDSFIDFDPKELNMLDDPTPAVMFAKARHLINKYDLKMVDGPLGKMKGLLDKYDKPEVWGHAAQVMDKDPGQLARMYENERGK